MESPPGIALQAPAQHPSESPTGTVARQALPIGFALQISRAACSATSARANAGAPVSISYNDDSRRPRCRCARRRVRRAPVPGSCSRACPPRRHVAARGRRHASSRAPAPMPSRGRSRAPSPCPSPVSLMLAGLRSQWMMPFSCAASSASAIWRAMSSATSSGSGPLARRSASVGPSTSSITMACTAAGDFETVNRGDVGMVQGGEQARLALQPGDALRIAGQRRRQHLDGDLSMQPRIERAIHLAHAARIERPEDAVRPELGVRRPSPALRGSRWRNPGTPTRRSPRPRQTIRRRRAPRATIPLHARARRRRRRHRAGTPRARPGAHASAASKISLTRGHRSRSSRHDRAARPCVMRRYSHARADCHSRVIVARDNDRTAATSSSESPPKYFSSTMCACRSSMPRAPAAHRPA